MNSFAPLDSGFIAAATRFAEDMADTSRAIISAAISAAPDVSIKRDGSYVTTIDVAVEDRLREMIGERYPAHGILGEERGAENADAEFTWVLDPIDGTAPFVAGIPVYGTLIALTHGGRPLIGVIDHPASDDRWVGIAGVSASFNGRPVHTRAGGDLADALMTNSNPDFLTAEEAARFHRLRQRVRYTQYGGSCYAYGVLASGRTDLAIDADLDPHDIIAGAAVIEGAGGKITDWSGEPITLAWRGQVLAAGDADLHAAALAVLNENE